jgi:hypothetical protein
LKGVSKKYVPAPYLLSGELAEAVQGLSKLPSLVIAQKSVENWRLFLDDLTHYSITLKMLISLGLFQEKACILCIALIPIGYVVIK